MPTADRTTCRAAVDALLDGLRENLTADPPVPAKPFRRVIVGRTTAEGQPRPALAVAVTRVRPVAAMDDDRLFLVTLALELSIDASAADAHGALFEAIGAIEDYFDSLRDSGVIEGAAFADARDWTLSSPATPAGTRAATAAATWSLVVRVEREHNRVPAD